MPQKFLHLNCFFTCGMTASNLLTFCSIVFAVGGWTRAPNTSASFVRARRSLMPFASLQLLVLVMAVHGAESHATDHPPYQKLARKRTRRPGPAGAAGHAGPPSCNRWSSHRKGRC